MPIPKYVSAEEYSRQSGLGVQEVKRLCKIGEIPCKRTEKGYYKIPIYEDCVPIEKYQEALTEIERLKTKLDIVSKIINN